MDLWPYVNGKAITLGLTLGEMEVSKMLDVLHFFFEQDSRFTTAEEAETVSEMRTRLYGGLYGTTYRYKTSNTTGNFNESAGVYDDGAIKPYIAPTDVDADSYLPFGSALESPLG